MPAAGSAWEISEAEFPYDAEPREQLRFLLRYAVLAPSLYNAQPWLFRIEGGCLEVISDRRRLLPAADPDQRQHVMSGGALLGALRLAARYFGYELSIALLPSPDVLAAVTLTPASGRESGERSLFLTLPKRRRNIQSFDPSMPSAELLQSLGAHASLFRAELGYAVVPPRRKALRALVLRAQSHRLADPAFHAELEQWLRPSFGSHCDGIPQEAETAPGSPYGLGAPEWADPSESSAWTRRYAAVARNRAHGVPVLAVLATPSDTPQDWLTAGALVLQIELSARACGVWLAEFPDAIEMPAWRARARRLLRLSGYPQALLGLGYGAEVPPLPRRPVDDMLLRDHSGAFSMH